MEKGNQLVAFFCIFDMQFIMFEFTRGKGNHIIVGCLYFFLSL